MKKYTPLDGLRWSRNSDSALNNMPQTDVLGRAGGGDGCRLSDVRMPTADLNVLRGRIFWFARNRAILPAHE